VVPRDLLSHYLGMLDPSCALTVDHEVTRHCAYNLPAVAFTLGRRHWPALRNLYRALAVDCQVCTDLLMALGVIHKGRPSSALREGGRVKPNADKSGQGGGGVPVKADVRTYGTHVGI